MKIILFGSNGMLGNYIKSYFKDKYEVISLTRKDIDLSSNLASYEIYKLSINKEDIIINAAGVIKQRSNDIKDMIKVNSLFPHILADVKEFYKCNVIHITTDCVFSGRRGNYKESDVHDCYDDYGKSKSLGENDNLTNIRTSIIGEEKLNKKSLLEWAISNKNNKVDGFKSHLWNGVTCLELAKIIENIIDNDLYWNGTRHYFSNTISKYELLNIINEVYDLNMTVNKVITDYCFRNLSSSYNKMNEKSIREQIIEMKKFKLL